MSQRTLSHRMERRRRRRRQRRGERERETQKANGNPWRIGMFRLLNINEVDGPFVRRSRYANTTADKRKVDSFQFERNLLEQICCSQSLARFNFSASFLSLLSSHSRGLFLFALFREEEGNRVARLARRHLPSIERQSCFFRLGAAAAAPFSGRQLSSGARRKI